MATQVLRIKTRKLLDRKLVRLVVGDVRPVTAGSPRYIRSSSSPTTSRRPAPAFTYLSLHVRGSLQPPGVVGGNNQAIRTFPKRP